MCIKNIGERTGLLWKLSEKHRAGETYFEKNQGQFKNRTQTRKDLLEVWAASPADALRTCGAKAEGEGEGSSTSNSLERKEFGPPCMQDAGLEQ